MVWEKGHLLPITLVFAFILRLHMVIALQPKPVLAQFPVSSRQQDMLFFCGQQTAGFALVPVTVRFIYTPVTVRLPNLFVSL